MKSAPAAPAVTITSSAEILDADCFAINFLSLLSLKCFCKSFPQSTVKLLFVNSPIKQDLRFATIDLSGLGF